MKDSTLLLQAHALVQFLETTHTVVVLETSATVYILEVDDVDVDCQSLANQCILIHANVLSFCKCKLDEGEEIVAAAFLGRIWRSKDLAHKGDPHTDTHRNEFIQVSHWEKYGDPLTCFLLPILRDKDTGEAFAGQERALAIPLPTTTGSTGGDTGSGSL